MEITITSTSKQVKVEGHVGSVPARVWEGKTKKGIRVIACITRIVSVTEDPAELAEFEADLEETRIPSSDVGAWPTRMIL